MKHSCKTCDSPENCKICECYTCKANSKNKINSTELDLYIRSNSELVDTVDIQAEEIIELEKEITILKEEIRELN